uniref:Lipase_GDSL domain-containing protein n=1 Tax=Angiostrongylus cantonensis TaxID=6313 RepID=A0A0K0DCB7_ANGCA
MMDIAGDSLANLSPEDINIIAAMGDALTAGRGLWDGTDVEFRGAAFPIGGDANIDGLVTIPNILLEFNQNLEGVAHGMGTRSRLPDYQLNVAESNTETESLPEQAIELIRRLNSVMSSSALARKWVLVTIATGTEELCNRCDTPDHSSIRRALGILRKGIPKAFVVLLGPVHVASSYKLHINLLK